ncbi:MAG: DUF6526 family protein [Ginsengibacter sp.]
MDNQNFKNHTRFVPGFHLLTGLSILAALAIAIIMVLHKGVSHETVFFLLVGLSLVLLFWYIRKFAAGNQDRIIRLEENLRSQRLTGKMSDNRLTRGQIIALRFAGDDEYVALSERAIKENMSPKEIKQAIQNWRSDHHRI